MIHLTILRIVNSIVRMLLLLSLCVRRHSFPITTSFAMVHGIGSILTMKLLVRIISSRVVVVILRTTTTTFSSLVVGPRPFIGRIVGRIILVLSVSIRMMIHHHVMMITTMVVIALMVRLKVVVYVIKVPLITSISIVSIVLIRHPDTLVLIIKLLHHHLFATGVVTAVVGITACGGGRGVVTSIVNLRFTCLDFAALTEDVQYASLPWDIV
mmetsp:Transcript_12914/g.19479  ORF Transcript_12914/g.19479 Transcript_12914/m.19479 type:complete len:212 (-) Transcript_12914:697-1332(-)